MTNPSCDNLSVRVLCLPDIDKAIGGVKQLYRHVEHLEGLGWNAAVVTENDGFRPTWFTSPATTYSFRECVVRGDFDSSETIIVLPETYLAIDFNAFRGVDLSMLPRVVFNQNAYYTFGESSADTISSIRSFYFDPSVLQVLSVSEDTHLFLSSNLGLDDSKLSRIINAIEPIFEFNSSKSNRIHWMPRKNPEHVQAVIHSLQSARLNYCEGWSGEPLVNISHLQVAERLNSARLFLSCLALAYVCRCL